MQDQRLKPAAVATNIHSIVIFCASQGIPPAHERAERTFA